MNGAGNCKYEYNQLGRCQVCHSQLMLAAGQLDSVMLLKLHKILLYTRPAGGALCCGRMAWAPPSLHIYQLLVNDAWAAGIGTVG